MASSAGRTQPPPTVLRLLARRRSACACADAEIAADGLAAWVDLVRPADRSPRRSATGGVPLPAPRRQHPLDRGVARNLLHEPPVGAIVVYYRDVTDRKATEEALQGDRGPLRPPVRRRRPTSSSKPTPRAISGSSIPQTLRVFGYARDEVIGRRFTEFIRADYRPPILQHYYQQTIEGVPNSYVEFPAVTKSGREVWLGQNAWLVFDATGQYTGMQAVARDITERRRAEEALRAAEAKYRGLVEQSLVGVYILQNDRLVYVNPKAADILGYTQQELLDLPMPSLVHEQDRAAGDRPAVAPAAAGARRRAADRARPAQGRRRRPGRGVLLGHRVWRPARPILATVHRHQRPRQARGAAAPGAEDGGGRPAGRRHRPRLQQPAHRHPRQRRADVASRQAGSGAWPRRSTRSCTPPSAPPR